MDKKQGDKQTEEQTAEKSAESKSTSSTGTAAKGTEAAKATTSSSASGKSSGSRRSSSRRSRGGKTGASSTSTPKSAAEEKASAKPGEPKDKPDATADSAGSQEGGKSAAAKAGKPPLGRRPSCPGAATAWLAAAIALLFALGAWGGWQLWQLDQEQRTLTESSESDQQQLADRIDSLSGELEQTRSAIDALEQRDEAIRQEVESALSDQLDQLGERQDGLDQRVARIDDRLARGEIAWKTAEVGFLLTRAQERLVIARDPEGAMLALELADERVAALSRPHWLPLRSAISDAIASIESASEGDRVGQALALRRLGDRVDQWPLAGRADQAAESTDPATPPAQPEPQPVGDAAWYEKAWAATTGWLSRQVSVTRSDKPVRLRERVATDREMRLWLTAVRESLLSRDRDALTTTLDESRDWLEAHYAVEAKGPAAALDAIERIRARFTSREFPSLNAVLQAWERASAHEKARADESGKETQS